MLRGPNIAALRATLRHLLPLLRQERKLVALGLLAVLLEVLATLAEPWPLKFVIDDVLPAALTGQPLPCSVCRCSPCSRPPGCSPPSRCAL
jgi:hypothetical protein